jgi:hypothetical protein
MGYRGHVEDALNAQVHAALATQIAPVARKARVVSADLAAEASRQTQVHNGQIMARNNANIAQNFVHAVFGTDGARDRMNHQARILLQWYNQKRDQRNAGQNDEFG